MELLGPYFASSRWHPRLGYTKLSLSKRCSQIERRRLDAAATPMLCSTTRAFNKHRAAVKINKQRFQNSHGRTLIIFMTFKFRNIFQNSIQKSIFAEMSKM